MAPVEGPAEHWHHSGSTAPCFSSTSVAAARFETLVVPTYAAITLPAAGLVGDPDRSDNSRDMLTIAVADAPPTPIGTGSPFDSRSEVASGSHSEVGSEVKSIDVGQSLVGASAGGHARTAGVVAAGGFVTAGGVSAGGGMVAGDLLNVGPLPGPLPGPPVGVIGRRGANGEGRGRSYVSSFLSMVNLAAAVTTLFLFPQMRGYATDRDCNTTLALLLVVYVIISAICLYEAVHPWTHDAAVGLRICIHVPVIILSAAAFGWCSSSLERYGGDNSSTSMNAEGIPTEAPCAADAPYSGYAIGVALCTMNLSWSSAILIYACCCGLPGHRIHAADYRHPHQEPYPQPRHTPLQHNPHPPRPITRQDLERYMSIIKPSRKPSTPLPTAAHSILPLTMSSFPFDTRPRPSTFASGTPTVGTPTFASAGTPLSATDTPTGGLQGLAHMDHKGTVQLVVGPAPMEPKTMPAIELGASDTSVDRQAGRSCSSSRGDYVALVSPPHEQGFAAEALPSRAAGATAAAAAAAAASEGGTCTICLDPLNPEKSDVRQLFFCVHRFHAGCLAQWVVANQRNACPNCRFPVVHVSPKSTRSFHARP
jgi:hypothetical protein